MHLVSRLALAMGPGGRQLSSRLGARLAAMLMALVLAAAPATSSGPLSGAQASWTAWSTARVRVADGRTATFDWRWSAEPLSASSKVAVTAIEVYNRSSFRISIGWENFAYIDSAGVSRRHTMGGASGFIAPGQTHRLSPPWIRRGTQARWNWHVTAESSGGGGGGGGGGNQIGAWEPWSATQTVTLPDGQTAWFQFRLRWDRVNGLFRPVMEVYNRTNAAISVQLQNIRDAQGRLIAAWSNATGLIAPAGTSLIVLPGMNSSNIRWTWSVSGSISRGGGGGGGQISDWSSWQNSWVTVGNARVELAFRSRRIRNASGDAMELEIMNRSSIAARVSLTNVRANGVVVASRTAATGLLGRGQSGLVRIAGVPWNSSVTWNWSATNR